MSTILDEMRPEDLGFDSRQFTSYRTIQLEAIEFATQSERRFVGIAAPTGAGKELIAASIHRLTGWRTVVLTSTKGLMEQYNKNHQRIGICDIRGKQNYSCIGFERTKCGDGKRMGCTMKVKCNYESARQDAKESQLVVSNYAYWLRAKKSALEYTEKEQLLLEANPIECLIMDEAHSAAEDLAGYLAVRLYEKELVEMLGWEGGEAAKDDLGGWISEAEELFREADIQSQNMDRLIKAKGGTASKAELDHAERLEALKDKLERVTSIQSGSGEWVCESKSSNKWGRSWEFDIIWPGQYAEGKLFQGIEHVVLMSATLRPKTMSLLGIGKDQYEFREWPRVFPAQRCPIYYLPARREDNTAVRLHYKSQDEDLKLWVEWIDQILESRADRKGIIHTVSYSRQQYLMEHSRFRPKMANNGLFVGGRLMGNTNEPGSENATEKCRQFKESLEPLVLCSPSFSTGWDFPGTTCEFVIIAKIPFPPGKGKAMQARKEKDGSYLNYLAMQELVQGCGRGMRSSEDRCETFIVDASLGWFLQQNKMLAPKWFGLAVKNVINIPPPSPKLILD